MGLFAPRLEEFDARANLAISKAEEKGIKIKVKIKMDQNGVSMTRGCHEVIRSEEANGMLGISVVTLLQEEK